jgi:hypothetical protein
MGEALPSVPKNGSTLSDVIDKIKDKDIDLSDSDWADLAELGLNVASAITGVTGFSPAAAKDGNGCLLLCDHVCFPRLKVKRSRIPGAGRGG